MLDQMRGRASYAQGFAAREGVSLDDVFAVLRHQRWLVFGLAAVCISCAAVYVTVAPRIFEATASLLIDIKRDDPLQRERPSNDSQAETTAIESQTQLLISDAVINAVVRELDLTRDPEFSREASVVPGFANWIPGLDRSENVVDVERITSEQLMKAVSAWRVGKTYVVSVSAAARDPDKAARIANAVAHAYIEDQLQARVQAAGRAAAWLKDRANELKLQSVEAERAVQKYQSQPDRDRIELRNLEIAAQTYRTVYEAVMQQFATTMQNQSFPVNYARIITPAKPPLRKSQPRTTLILAGALIGGLGLGWLAGFSRERLRRRLRTAQEVEQASGIRSIGRLPEVRSRPNDLWSQSTAFSQTIGSVKAALSLASNVPPQVIGVISAQAGDGKTTAATALAFDYAKDGHRTLLLDCNFDDGQAGRMPGVLDIVFGSATLSEVIVRDQTSGICVLHPGQFAASLAEAVTTPAFGRLMDELRAQFERIVVDVPCLETVTSARAAAAVVDAAVVVCASGRTSADNLAAALDRWSAGDLFPIGFVLNRVSARSDREFAARRIRGKPAASDSVPEMVQ